ncbi:MAG: hypothetical protein MPW16_21410 (plasmid) [Candidatus Manganitrophus sp.]|nr:MAG: hypothetical protein MPW16_21410 [Candidatus Manganitrophus sp.]
MKWYGWSLIVVLIIFSNIATLWVTKHALIKIRVVDTVALIDHQRAKWVKLANEGEITFDEALARQKAFLGELERDLQGEPLVFIKQCVLGKHEDITARFEQKN